jgi:tetratricopeptide (TPR) repeat protein/DNA-binding MarR family transcriptional regulator
MYQNNDTSMATLLSDLSLPVDKRILLHIMEFSKFENQFEVPFAISQEGIAKAIGIRRDNVPRAMKELKNADLVIEKVARVEGVYRKRKVYFLTDHGFKFIQELKNKILSSEVLLKYEDGRIEPVKISEVNIKIKLPLRLGLIEILNNLSTDGTINIKSVSQSITQPTAQEGNRVDEVKDGSADGSKFVEFIDDAPNPRNFVGREKELLKIRSSLESNEHNIIVIYGIPGIGKTALASKVMSQFRNTRHIFWYRFHRWDTMRNTLLVFSDFLAKTHRRRLKSYLSGKHNLDLNDIAQIMNDELDDANILLVFDDFQRVKEDIAEFFSLLVEILSRIKGVDILVVGRRILPFYDRGDVIVKKLIIELQLAGLDEPSSRKMLKVKNLKDEVFQRIYKLTNGHPLFLELIRDVKDITDQKDIKRYIYEEIFSSLEDREKVLMNILSVFRYPTTSSAVYIDESMDHEVLDSLVERNLVMEIAYDQYDVHDMVREFFYIRLPPNIRKRYHLAAAKYYIEDGSTMASIEAQYHFIKAGEYVKAVSLAIANGDEIINKGHLEEFLNLLEEIKRKNTPEKYQADIMFLKAEILTITGDLKTALEYYNQALLVSDKTDTPLVKSKALRKIGHIYRTQSDLKHAESNLNESLNISKKMQDQMGLADTYRGLGEIFGIRGDFEKAIELLLKSLEFAKGTDDSQILAKVYMDLGTVYGNMGDHDKAIEYHEKCIEVLEETGDIYSKAKVMNNLGVVYLDKAKYDKALEYFEECINISRNTGDIRQLAYGLTNASEIYTLNSKLDLAKEYLEESFKIFNKVGDRFKLAGAYCNYGVIYSNQKKWDQAIEYFSKGVSILEDLHHSYYLAKKYFDFGKIYETKMDNSNAKKYYKKANTIFSKLGIKHNVPK